MLSSRDEGGMRELLMGEEERERERGRQHTSEDGDGGSTNGAKLEPAKHGH
jgi:hypothetical protein